MAPGPSRPWIFTSCMGCGASTCGPAETVDEWKCDCPPPTRLERIVFRLRYDWPERLAMAAARALRKAADWLDPWGNA